jgi:4-hydroxy-4-methyl-2-oxoglutarate aldolase
MAESLWSAAPAAPPPPSPEVLAALAALPSAIVGDAMGGLGVMAARVRHVGGPARLCAPAFTVDAHPSDNLALHRAVADPAAAGRAVVVSAGDGAPCGLFGDLMLRAAVARGVAGLVVDGYVRDGDDLAAAAVPVFAIGLHPRKAVKANPGRLGWPVACGGVAVAPGDIVVADRDGVAVVPAALAARVAKTAQALLEREEDIRSAVAAGRRLADVLSLDLAGS